MFRMKCSTSSLGPIGQVHASALSWMMVLDDDVSDEDILPYIWKPNPFYAAAARFPLKPAAIPAK